MRIQDAADLRMVVRVGRHTYVMAAFGYNKRDLLSVAKQLEAKGFKIQLRKWSSTSDQRRFHSAGKYQYGLYVYRAEELPDAVALSAPAWV